MKQPRTREVWFRSYGSGAQEEGLRGTLRVPAIITLSFLLLRRIGVAPRRLHDSCPKKPMCDVDISQSLGFDRRRTSAPPPGCHGPFLLFSLKRSLAPMPEKSMSCPMTGIAKWGGRAFDGF